MSSAEYSLEISFASLPQRLPPRWNQAAPASGPFAYWLPTPWTAIRSP